MLTKLHMTQACCKVTLCCAKRWLFTACGMRHLTCWAASAVMPGASLLCCPQQRILPQSFIFYMYTV